MARMPKCSGCQHCDLIKVTCEIYKDGIPTNILIELQSCEHYTKEKTADVSDDNVLIAKGR